MEMSIAIDCGKERLFSLGVALASRLRVFPDRKGRGRAED